MKYGNNYCSSTLESTRSLYSPIPRHLTFGMSLLSSQIHCLWLLWTLGNLDHSRFELHLLLLRTIPGRRFFMINTSYKAWSLRERYLTYWELSNRRDNISDSTGRSAIIAVVIIAPVLSADFSAFNCPPLAAFSPNIHTRCCVIQVGGMREHYYQILCIQ